MQNDVATIARGLTKAQRLALTSDWDHFCQCDWQEMSCDVDGFEEALEAAGFVEFDAVSDDDLQQPFADELGIEAGGSVWRLTKLGAAVRAHLLTEVSNHER